MAETRTWHWHGHQSAVGASTREGKFTTYHLKLPNLTIHIIVQLFMARSIFLVLYNLKVITLIMHDIAEPTQLGGAEAGEGDAES